MCPQDNDAPTQANRKQTYDRPEMGRHGKTHPDNALNQISNQSNIHKHRNLSQIFYRTEINSMSLQNMNDDICWT